MFPPGDFVNRGFFNKTVAMPCFAVNFDDMKECDAPESNNIVARCNIPDTLAGD